MPPRDPGRDAPCPACTPASPCERCREVSRLVAGDVRRAYWAAQQVWDQGGLVRRLGAVEDAAQIAVILLYRAARKYRPERGAKFGTYAVRTIKLELQKEGCTGGLIRVPPGMAWERSRKFRELSPACRAAAVAALDATEQLPGKFGEGELVEDRSGGTDPAEEVADAEEREILRRRLNEALATLPARLRLAVEARYGLGGQAERDLAGVAELLGGMSRERARQLIRGALQKMRAEMERMAA